MSTTSTKNAQRATSTTTDTATSGGLDFGPEVKAKGNSDTPEAGLRPSGPSDTGVGSAPGVCGPAGDASPTPSESVPAPQFYIKKPDGTVTKLNVLRVNVEKGIFILAE
jgi:hypothetical protein